MESIEGLPTWLETPLTYYQKPEQDLRLELFQHICKDSLSLNDKNSKYVVTILKLFNLSQVILEDVTNGVETRWGVKAIHVEHGAQQVTLWGLGLSHFIYKFIAEKFHPDEFAFKVLQLYNDFGCRMIDFGTKDPLDFLDEEDDDVEANKPKEEEEDKYAKKDFREVVRRKLECYIASFPLALYALLKTENLQNGMRMMEDDDLIEIGYLLEAEKDFKGHFENGNMDITNKKWTILIDLLSKKMDKYEYPATKEKASELFEKYDVYSEYVKSRENGLESLRYGLLSMKMSQMKGIGTSDIFQAKYNAVQFYLDYFDSFKYKGSYPKKEPAVPSILVTQH